MYRKRVRSMAAPVAMSMSVEQQTGQKAITLSGREFIKDIVAPVFIPQGSANGSTITGQFNASSQFVTPSDSSVFSWLSGIAAKFEEYRFNAVAFVYEPVCNTYTTGSVGVFFDPDPTNSPPASWQTFTNTGCNTHGAPWAKHVLVIPSRYLRDRRKYYVKDQFLDAATTAPLPLTDATQQIDPLEYYLGLIGSTSQGQSVTLGAAQAADGYAYVNLGKLYIEYNVTLSKATLDVPPRTAQYGFGAATLVATNYRTGPTVSSYWSALSGNGLKIKPSAWPAAGSLAPVFGTSGTTSSSIVGTMDPSRSNFWGDQIFNWTASLAGVVGPPAIAAKSGVRALQTLDLMYVVCLSSCTVLTEVSWRFENQQNEKSTLSGYNESFKTSANAGGGVVACGTLHINAGDRVSLLVNYTTNPGQATSHVWLVPCTYGLDQ